MENKFKNAIRLHSGGIFYYLNPELNEYRIEDIAWGLSRNTRFGGHPDKNYSIAEHCVNVSNLVPEYDAFAALMHDAAEGYLGDIPTPFKNLLPDYKKIEAIHDGAIASHFDYQYPFSSPVKEFDWLCCVNEYYEFFGEVREDKLLPIDEVEPIEGLFKFHYYEQKEAYEVFMKRFHELYWH